MEDTGATAGYGSRIDVRDRLVRRGDRDAVVTYHWQVAPGWDDEHLLEIVVAQLEPGGGVRACSERLSLWPYRYDDLVAELLAVGLTVDESTFDPAADGYQLVASHEPGWTPLAVRGTSR